MTKYLQKANDDVLSFCQCTRPFVSLPSQADCPWCGCGWLIGCIDCRKAFTFAEVVDVNEPYHSIVKRDAAGRGLSLNDDEIVDAVEMVASLMEPLSLGTKVVYLDGCFVAVDEPEVRFTGLFARHDLDVLPQVAARTNGARLEILKDPDYWLARERPDRD